MRDEQIQALQEALALLAEDTDMNGNRRNALERRLQAELDNLIAEHRAEVDARVATRRPALSEALDKVEQLTGRRFRNR